MGAGFGFDWRFGWSLRLDAHIGRVVWVASFELLSSLNRGGRQMLGLNSQRLLSPRHEDTE
jgi:hypothetical protein